MKEFDVVSLKSASFGLPSGAIGTIVHVQIKQKVFLVEFCDSRGRTLALENLSCNELELVTAYDG